MAASSRERVTIDLRGIGEAVRQAGAERGTTVAALARQALVQEIGPRSIHGTAPVSAERATFDPVVKLTLRLRSTDAEALMLAAGGLGLSYGEYVTQLVRGMKLPAPSAERRADRVALLASTDQLAVLATDLHAFMRLLAKLDLRGMEPYRGRIRSLDDDLRRHIDLASRLIAGRDDSKGATR